MGVIYVKIWSDLWHHKTRTLQVLLIHCDGRSWHWVGAGSQKSDCRGYYQSVAIYRAANDQNISQPGNGRRRSAGFWKRLRE